eukprot:gene5001-3596_t
MVDILLDPSIRDWVLFPIVAIVIVVGILRHYVTVLMASKAKEALSNIHNQAISNYGSLLISAGEILCPEAFASRAQDLLQNQLKREVETETIDMTDPSIMGSMLQNQMMGLVNNFGLMMLVSFFFSGFVVAQFPFGVPLRLKEMMQRGIDIDDLECSYVTSISFYFLALAGSSGILQLLLGSDAEVNNMGSLEQLQGQGGLKQPTDYKKVYKQISEELKLVTGHHRWTVEEAPGKLLREWKAEMRKSARSAAQ